MMSKLRSGARMVNETDYYEGVGKAPERHTLRDSCPEALLRDEGAHPRSESGWQGEYALDVDQAS
jgi:hypothetical protein